MPLMNDRYNLTFRIEDTAQKGHQFWARVTAVMPRQLISSKEKP